MSADSFTIENPDSLTLLYKQMQQQAERIVALAIQKAEKECRSININNADGNINIPKNIIIANDHPFPIKTIVLHTFSILDSKIMGAGDRNHVQALIHQFQCLYQNGQIHLEHHPVESKEWTELQFQEWILNLQQQLKNDNNSGAAPSTEKNKKHVLLAVGGHGLKLLQQMFQEQAALTKQIITVWEGHQYFKGLENIINKVNIIGLPIHALDTKLNIKNNAEWNGKTIGTVIKKSTTHLVETNRARCFTIDVENNAFLEIFSPKTTHKSDILDKMKTHYQPAALTLVTKILVFIQDPNSKLTKNGNVHRN